MVVYRGWAKSGADAKLFETYAEDLQEGDILRDHSGREWRVDVIIDPPPDDGKFNFPCQRSGDPIFYI